jgi:protein-S-isoprenylcysteine O-methyltransferase Ste14
LLLLVGGWKDVSVSYANLRHGALLRGQRQVEQATVFLTRGSYGLSRNPMYLGLFLIHSGIAILKGTGWPFATIVIPFLLLDRIVVPFEERQMAERFGSPYRDYCRRVGRWLNFRAPAQRAGP